MATKRHTPEELPRPIKQRLDELTASLKAALGGELAALLIFGSAVRGGYREGLSDIDALVVLRDDAREKLEAISNALALARYSARIEAILLTAEELKRSADVFPLFYDDIRRCHLLLAGEDPFAGLEISDQHRRLRIEQELREIQIRLRRAFVEGLGSPEALAAAVERKLKQLRGPLFALLSLRGVACDEPLEAVLNAAGGHYKVDTAPLLAAPNDARRAYAALTALLHAAIRDVDRDEPR